MIRPTLLAATMISVSLMRIERCFREWPMIDRGARAIRAGVAGATIGTPSARSAAWVSMNASCRRPTRASAPSTRAETGHGLEFRREGCHALGAKLRGAASELMRELREQRRIAAHRGLPRRLQARRRSGREA